MKIVNDIIVKFSTVVITTVCLHWFLVNSYVYFCAPATIFGAFKTFLSLGSPVCHTVNLLQYELAKHYITIWTGAGIAIVAWGIKMLQIGNEVTQTNVKSRKRKQSTNLSTRVDK